MSNELFIAGTTIFLGVLFRWGFRALPDEKWQFLASIPCRRRGDGSWDGVNLTFYGFFNAFAHIIAVAFLLILTGAIGVSADAILSILFVLMAFCIPSSKLLARLIENKSYTFTVGGASFIGIILAPFVTVFIYHIRYSEDIVPLLPILTAMAIAYAVGEGIGRLACISFGCCYGKPIDDCHPLLKNIFYCRAFVFTGMTKKIAYERGLEGCRVFPIQAVTSTILTGVAIAGTALFLIGSYGLAFFLTVIVTQGWRVVSESLRADHRGGGTFSVYQCLAVLASIYALILWLFLPPAGSIADIQQGLRSLWHPGVILFLLIWGAVIFWYTGRSRVTGARISFHINKERI